jgi:hypothetical protein
LTHAKKPAPKSGRRGTVAAKSLTRQPRVKGEHRQPRGTSLLAAIDAALEHESAVYGVSRPYVLACCAAVVLGVNLPPDLMYRTFPRFHLVRGRHT